jgi:hypothetical protein
LVLSVLTGWLDRGEREAVTYLIEANRLLRRQLDGRRLRLTDDDRRRLACRVRKPGLRRQDVLANHTAETIATLDTSLARDCCSRERSACRMGRSEAQCSVRSVDVVVIHEDGEDPFEVLSVQDQQPVETLRAHGPHKPLGHPVRLRSANGVRMISMPSLRNTSSKLSVNF